MRWYSRSLLIRNHYSDGHEKADISQPGPLCDRHSLLFGFQYDVRTVCPVGQTAGVQTYQGVVREARRQFPEVLGGVWMPLGERLVSFGVGLGNGFAHISGDGLENGYVFLLALQQQPSDGRETK